MAIVAAPAAASACLLSISVVSESSVATAVLAALVVILASTLVLTSQSSKTAILAIAAKPLLTTMLRWGREARLTAWLLATNVICRRARSSCLERVTWPAHLRRLVAGFSWVFRASLLSAVLLSHALCLTKAGLRTTKDIWHAAKRIATGRLLRFGRLRGASTTVGAVTTSEGRLIAATSIGRRRGMFIRVRMLWLVVHIPLSVWCTVMATVIRVLVAMRYMAVVISSSIVEHWAIPTVLV